MRQAAPKHLWPRLTLSVLLAGFAGRAAADDAPQPDAFRPDWQIGLAWVVESTGLQTAGNSAAASNRPARFQFTVKSLAKLDGRQCYLVEVKCLDAEVQPATTLWVDRASMTLRRVATQVPVPGGFRDVVETYGSASGQPFPAFAPLTNPPLELPYLMSGVKGDQTFVYDVTGGPQEAKQLGDVGFRFGVTQQFSSPDPDSVGELLPDDYTKDVRRKPSLEVRLQMAPAKAYQLWQQGSPWPVYAENGVAKSRLVEIRRPN